MFRQVFNPCETPRLMKSECRYEKINNKKVSTRGKDEFCEKSREESLQKD